MSKKVFVLDGSKFSDIEEFYDTIYKLLTNGLDWEIAHNLDALNDILYGGFGAYEGNEEIILNWINFSKSRKDLGVEPSIAYYEKRAKGLSGKRAEYFQQKANELRKGMGESLIDTILKIIYDHPRITLITED